MNDDKITDVRRKEKDMAALSKPYLVLYNSVQTAGWSLILFETVKHLIKYKSVEGLWKVCGTNVVIFQTLAALEVFHSIFKIVSANPVTTLTQVTSRLVQVWGALVPCENVQNYPTLGVVLIAWSIAEVIRYSYYCAQLLGKPSSFHSWCRYSMFFVLYPAGCTGELINMYLAMDTIKRRQIYSILLPNKMNFSFNYYYINIFIMMTYVPLFPQLFGHMMKLRKKVLGAPPKKEK